MSTIRFTVVLIVLAGLVAGIVLAGPVLPSKPAVADEVISLANLKRLQLDVQPLLGVPGDTEGLHEHLTDRLRRQLTDADVEIVEDRTAPRLVMQVTGTTHRDHGPVVGLTVILTLYQQVTVERLDRSLNTPTAVIVSTRLAGPDQVKPALEQRVTFLTKSLLDYIDNGTTAMSNAEH